MVAAAILKIEISWWSVMGCWFCRGGGKNSDFRLTKPVTVNTVLPLPHS